MRNLSKGSGLWLLPRTVQRGNPARSSTVWSLACLRDSVKRPSVQALQERLTQLGYLTDPYDGMYGSTTADCVSRFQTANGLEATGIADPATQAALFASGALREDGTPLPEESGESSTSQSSSSTSESSSSASESSASESSSQASSASSASESSSQTSASQ